MNHEQVGELRLRRFRAGELPPPEAHECGEHVEACSACRGRLKALEQEQRRFEQEIPFERFAAGVQRAARSTPPGHSLRWTYPALGIAAAALIAVVVVPEINLGRQATWRAKGGAEIELRIGGLAEGIQRIAPPRGLETLQPGERIRIGYQPGDHRYIASISIDEQGAVTPLYPESGRSLPVERGDEMHYLPDSVELTGDGLERIIVVLSDEPIDLDQLAEAAQSEFRQADGDLRRVLRLDVPGEQFSRVLLKP